MTLRHNRPSLCPSSLRCYLSIAGLALLFALLLSFEATEAAQSRAEREVAGVTPSAVGSYRNSWAVVIGINRYTRAPRLNYAVSDAKSVVAAVQQLGFPSNNILLLLDLEATKQRIEQLFYETLSQASPEDRVFVFFAGHGVTAALPRGGEEGYLLPVDGDPDNLPLTAISMDDVRKISRRIPAKHILFAVDACYSGFAITRDVPPARVDSAYLEAVTKEPAVQIITAGRKGEPVLEEEGHGLFTRRMIQGIKGLADTDQNGIITAQELATWLESRVIRDSQNRQHPQYSRLDGEGQFVFVVPRREEEEKQKRLAEEAERQKREKTILEEQRKLQARREALLAERQKIEEKLKAEMAQLESESTRLKAEEERIAKEKARPEEARLEAERKRPIEEVTKVPPPQAIAKLSLPPVPARPATVVPGVAELPKYQVGDSWTLRLSDGRTVTRRIRSIERDFYVLESAPDRWQYLDRELVLRNEMTPGGKNWNPYLLNQRFIEFPISVNKTWEKRVLVQSVRELQGGIGAESGGITRYWRVFSFKVLGSEVVSTPAGAFGAFKIEESSREIICPSSPPCEDVPHTSTLRHWWYAPEARYFVKVVNMSGYAPQGYEEDYELIAFDLK